MDKSEIISRITPVFENILEEDDLVLTDDLTANDVENWDSLAHVRLIVAIEEELGIRFDLTTAANAKNIGDMLNQIEKLV